nr:SUKH-4 family immunity protein [Micromonospora sp. KC213]
MARGPVLVNSSLDQYVATVLQATARFPYDDGCEEPDFSSIADDLRAHLARIDPAAWEVDRYWDTFYWDVMVGDYHSILFMLGDGDT